MAAGADPNAVNVELARAGKAERVAKGVTSATAAANDPRAAMRLRRAQRPPLRAATSGRAAAIVQSVAIVWSVQSAASARSRHLQARNWLTVLQAPRPLKQQKPTARAAADAVVAGAAGVIGTRPTALRIRAAPRG